MLRILFSIINRWDNIGKWYESKTRQITSIKGYLLHIVIILLVLFLTASSFSIVFSLIMIYLPRLLTFIILICIGFSLFTIIIGAFLKRINIGLWIVACLLSVLLTIIGFSLSWFITIIETVNIHTNLLPHETRFPLSMLNGIAINSDGRIYLAIKSYSRIQVYSKEGDYLGGWFVNTTKREFNIWIDEDKLLHVITKNFKKS